jgi:YfiR/HmsC-like
MSRANVTNCLQCSPHSRRGFWVRLAALVISLSYVIPISQTQQSRPTEYQVKAAYLYNFGKFVDWSTTGAAVKDDSFAICVLGQDPFGPTLDATLAKQSIEGKNVVARRITKPQEALSCRILFISSSEDRQLNGILAALNGAAVLTVSDIPQFSQRGGMIEFTVEGNNVRFEVNLKIAKNAGLTLSSELLKVAFTVRRNPQPGS